MIFPITGITLYLIVFMNIQGFAQCQVWQTLPEEKMKELQESYVVYRDMLKKEEYTLAFFHWQIVYEEAPAADGQRSFVYSDGRKFYLRKFKAEKNKQKKATIASLIFDLREEQKACYPAVELEELPSELLKLKKK